jgi:hypothetical protein
MKLKGVLDFSLGNFLCLRGFAAMGELCDNSEPDPSYQRKHRPSHQDEMVKFLKDGEYTFFPELILSLSLEDCGLSLDEVDAFYTNVRGGTGFPQRNLGRLTVSCFVNASAKGEDRRAKRYHKTATIGFKDNDIKIHRIDGNHRLLAAGKCDDTVKGYNSPYCLMLFRNNEEALRFSTALFHNINYKQMPLTMEENLKIILDDTNIFPDDKLKEHEFFGWPYYHARKLHGNLDLGLLPNIAPFLNDEPRTFLLHQFEFLSLHGVLNDNENAIRRFKDALVRINSLFDAAPALKESSNHGLLAALVYYELKKGAPISSFVNWVVSNQLHLIKGSTSGDLIAIFDKILTSRRRTIFVSMAFRNETKETYLTIQKVVKQINEKHKLDIKLREIRIDQFNKGHSYTINDEILKVIEGTGLLIADLTFGNRNVYHEIGYLMGLNQGKGLGQENFIFIADQKTRGEELESDIGFNLKPWQQLRFESTRQLEVALTASIEHYYNLSS